MSIEALWSVSFESSFGMSGAGVAVFETGRIFGGDSSMIYTGHFRVANGEITGEVQVERYAPGLESVVHLDKFDLCISGKADDRQMILQGQVVADSSRTIGMSLVRRAELP